MIPFEEDIVDPECDGVYYQTPDELKVKGDPSPDIVHDDSLSYKDGDHDDYEEDKYDDHDDDDYEHRFDYHDHHHHDDHHDHWHHHHHFDHECDEPDCHVDMSPIEAIRKIKSNPSAVSITKLNGKYYIDHHDLRCYMDACGESNYECALNNIISAHNEDGLASDNVGIVVGESDMLKLDPEIKSAMESSSVNFEVYG